MIVTLIAALGLNRVIGDRGEIPWFIKEDMKFFRETTMGKPIIMGRKTFDSIGKPLDGRKNIVLTRDVTWKHPGVVVVHSVKQALKEAKGDECMVIGGAEIYELFMPDATRLILTEVDSLAPGDAHFPKIKSYNWDRRETARCFTQNGEPSYRRAIFTRREPLAIHPSPKWADARIKFPEPSGSDLTSYRSI